MKTSERGREAIAAHEGCVLKAYPDPGTGGEPWTIGVGHTGGVKPGDCITHEEAMALLAEDLKTAEAAVNGAVKVPISQGAFDSLVSFTFNVGAGAFKRSTLVRLLNFGDYTGAANEFLRWNRAGGRVMAGLTKRRKEEREMFIEKP